MTPVVGSDGTLFVTEWTPGGDESDHIVADPFEEMAARYDANKNNQLERNELPPGPLASRFDQIDRNKDGHITAREYEWARNIFKHLRRTPRWRSARCSRRGDRVACPLAIREEPALHPLARVRWRAPLTWSRAAGSSRASMRPAVGCSSKNGCLPRTTITVRP